MSSAVVDGTQVSTSSANESRVSTSSTNGPASSTNGPASSTNGATSSTTGTLLRMEQSGGIDALFPQIGQCSDQDLALFHANLALGSRMIRSDSFLKGAAAKYLEAAFKMRPDDLAAMGNYAVALFWQGRRDMAKELFCRGGARAAQLFETLRVGCAKQQRHIGMYEFSCPTVPYPGPEQSELMRRVDGDRLVFSA